MSIFSTIAADVSGIFKNPNASYNALVAEEQKAATWVSGAMAVINQNPAIKSTLLIPIIQDLFPEVPIADITNVFIQIAKVTTDTPPTTLGDAITAIQTYLSTKTGSVWITIVNGLVSIGTAFISPTTPIQKFITVVGDIYDDIIKPILGLKTTPVPAVASPSTPALSVVNVDPAGES